MVVPEQDVNFSLLTGCVGSHIGGTSNAFAENGLQWLLMVSHRGADLFAAQEVQHGKGMFYRKVDVEGCQLTIARE